MPCSLRGVRRELFAGRRVLLGPRVSVCGAPCIRYQSAQIKKENLDASRSMTFF